MEKFKGTPGPWKKTFSIVGVKRAVRCPGYLIATLNPPTRFGGQDERYEAELKIYEADHNLIHASPDLLEVVQLCKELFDSELMPSERQCVEYSNRCKLVIDKALGL